RPSSPIIAKASTTCTCSLDPITVLPLRERRREPKSLTPSPDHRKLSRLCIPRWLVARHDAIHNPVSPLLAPHANNTREHFRENNYLLSRLLKSRRGVGGSGWIRTIDPRLIKTVL